MALGSDAPLSEPRLALKAEAVGVFDAVSYRPVRVATARLTVDADNDQLEAQLAEPVDCTAAAPVVAAVDSRDGQHRALADAGAGRGSRLDPWQVDGQSQVTADIRAASNLVDVANAKATVTNLHVTGVGWNIAEPRVELAADLHWNLATNEIASQSAQVVSSAVALATKDVHVNDEAAMRSAAGDRRGGVSRGCGAAGIVAGAADAAGAVSAAGNVHGECACGAAGGADYGRADGDGAESGARAVDGGGAVPGKRRGLPVIRRFGRSRK